MQDPDILAADVYLQPGEMFFAHQPTIIRTLLGSCVGVTFWSQKLLIGALFHAMLPKCPEGFLTRLRVAEGYRYVDFSIREIARQFDEIGVKRSEIQVKVFGGADVLLGGSQTHNRATVGSMNCDCALEVLNKEGFRVIASSIRGTSGLNIHFNSGNGEVLLRRLTDCSVLPSSGSRDKADELWR